jgi:hypothetical protein
MSRLPGLTHAEHQFCAVALARVQHTCASSEHLRDRTIGPYLKKVIRGTEKLRRYLERYCDGYGYYSAEQNVVLSWVELRQTLEAVGNTINDKVRAKVIDAYLKVRSAVILTSLKLRDCGLMDDS